MTLRPAGLIAAAVALATLAPSVSLRSASSASLRPVSSVPSVPSVVSTPSVSLWYRGTPAGTPRADELAVIRALGFDGVTWPAALASGKPALDVLAAAAGLAVSVGERSLPLQPDAAPFSGARLDLRVTDDNAAALAPIVWRAVARGTRVVAFDAGTATGHGLEREDRSLLPWARDALAIARQFSANERLFESLRPGPGITISPAPTAGFDMVLLDADRSWLVIATNASAAARRGTARLPSGVPYAIWVDLLDGSTLAMTGEPAGPRWQFTLAPRSARLYVTDKRQK